MQANDKTKIIQEIKTLLVEIEQLEAQLDQRTDAGSAYLFNNSCLEKEKTMRKLDSNCAEGGRFAALKVECMRIRAVWLLHGAIAATATVLIKSNPLTNLISGDSTVAHRWVEIQAEGGHWFCAQFGNMPECPLELIHCSSQEAVDREGVRAAGRSGDDPDISTNRRSEARPAVTMLDVYRFMEKTDDDYHLLANNCQHFAARLVDAFDQLDYKPGDLILPSAVESYGNGCSIM